MIYKIYDVRIKSALGWSDIYYSDKMPYIIYAGIEP